MQANNNEQAAAIDDNDNELPQCMICYTDLKHPCVTPCGHDEICGTCHLRLRHLHSDKKCPLCKQENAQLIVDTYSDIKPFEEYPLWGNELGSDFSYREDVGMFFPSEHYEQEVLPLFGYHCGQCNQYDGVTPEANMYEEKNQQQKRRGKQQQQPKTPLRLLQDHLRNKHRTTLCSLCVDFKRDFVSRLPRFSPTQLKHHLQTGDGDDSGFRGHPVCEFCRPKRFYDLTNLHMHLQKDHYKCHVCDKAGLANQYFRDYNALERHFDKQHFLCQDVQCLAARFMVFDNEIDLRAHEVSVHGTGGGANAKIQVEFRVRREGYSGAGYENQTVPSGDDFQYGLDGQAFVPEALPAVALDEATSHPQHFRRTAELRAQAAEIRATQEAEEYNHQEAFPSLGSENNNNNNLRMGWTANSGTLQRITKKKTDSSSREQFPSLPTSSSGGRKSVAAKLRNSGGGNRQFSAMRQAAMGSAPAPTSNNWSGASSVPRTAAAPTPFISATGGGSNRQSNLQADNFPSLGGATKTRAAYPSMSSAYGGGGGATSTNRSATPPNLSSGNNFPSLGGGPAPKMSNNNFPSLGGATKTRATYPVNNHMKHSQSAPSLHNAAHFPPPPAAARNNNSVRQKLLGQKPAAPANNMANFPAPSSSLQQGMATVGEMKASLGTNKYKELKNLTKEFATDASLAPHAYVDHAAALFDGGYGDADFWGFVPGLLLSCPNQTSAAAALRYMDDLKRATTSTTRTATAPAPSWSASSAVVAPPPPKAAAAAKPAGGYYFSTTSSSASRAATRVAKHQANSWGAGGAASSVTRAKAAPASVAVAAASQGPQGVGGNATSYKEKKQDANNNNGGGGKKKKNKNKKNNDLRALAFGK